MKNLNILLFLLCLAYNLEAQDCPPNSILVLTTQEDVDNFPSNYPGCTEILGSVQMMGMQITNLDSLIYITSIEGYLHIKFNWYLTSISGLENLTSVGGSLDIAVNHILSSISGLENLSSVGGAITISNNDSLTTLLPLASLSSAGSGLTISGNNITNLTGLENLSSVGGILRVNNNENLVSLEGLDNLTSIASSLDIQGNVDLVDLTALSNLTSIGNYLSINSNSSLTNLTGLENLTTIPGFLRINNNNNLLDLTALENINSVGGYLSVDLNESLTSLTGLENITAVPHYLQVSGNNNLTDLTGLENISSIGGYLRITSNANLTSLSVLENLTSLGGNLEINNNPELSICSIEPICNILVNGNNIIDVYDNGIGCNSEEDLFEGCNLIGRINHPIFYDLNADGLFDFGEPYLSMGQVLIEPGGITSFGNSTNGGRQYLYFDDYMVSYDELATPNWDLTSVPGSSNISLDSLNKIDTIYFGIYPNVDISDLEPMVVSGNFRCNEYVTFDLYADNKGTTTTDGTLWFTVDENVLDVVFIDTPDTIINPNIYGWHFETLYPANTVVKQISLQMPGPPDFPLGDELTFISEINYTDLNGVHNSETSLYRNEVLCGFDPNDKLVNPVYPFNYALIGEELIYTIRFQNTGNAEAYDVVIRDTLDLNLDPSTFRFIASSHDAVLSASMEMDQYLTFDFHDIFLPDSTTNFDESQGYVVYAIQAFDGIDETTVISNSASIYFDYNPAILTNTTENVMLYSFDADLDGYTIFEDYDDTNALINPGVTEIPYNGIDDDCNEASLDDDLDGDGFGIAEDCDDMNALINPDATEIVYNGIDDDCDETSLDDDLDGDGFGIAGDCDDMNALINPDATEIVYNGIDDDCDESSLDDDLDGDGFGIAEDCDDMNSSINPNATEIPNNGIDEDCDGEDLMVTTHEANSFGPSIFPNPTTGLIGIQLHESTRADLQIRDFTGKLVIQKACRSRTSLNLSDLPDGVYVLVIQTENHLWAERVLKLN